MALTLHLLRHAKSSWKEPGQEDHDRPLSGRGRRAAEAIGAFLAREGPVPDRVLCSSAVRTLETWERMRPSLGDEPSLSIEPALYLASAARMLEVLQEQDGSASCVLLVGHNPGTEDLARALAGCGDEDAWHRIHAKYPTAGLTTLRFDATVWQEVVPAAGKLVQFVVPRDLP
jgi:phosphohistidine phosphatase